MAGLLTNEQRDALENRTLEDVQADIEYSTEDFAAHFNAIAFYAHETAKHKGWWERPRNAAELVGLIHHEVSEALTEFRNDPYAQSIKLSTPELHVHKAAEELADVIIRIMDMAVSYGYTELGDIIIAKMKYNLKRPHKHDKPF